MATARGQTLLISGFITAVATGFAEGGLAGARGVGRRRHLPDDARHAASIASSRRRCSDAVNKVASENGFDLRVRRHAAEHVTLDSNLQTDLEFLGKLAQNFSTTGAEVGILRPRRRAPGQAPFPAAPQG